MSVHIKVILDPPPPPKKKKKKKKKKHTHKQTNIQTKTQHHFFLLTYPQDYVQFNNRNYKISIIQKCLLRCYNH